MTRQIGLLRLILQVKKMESISKYQEEKIDDRIILLIDNLSKAFGYLQDEMELGPYRTSAEII